jgi:hypothetical protein
MQGTVYKVTDLPPIDGSGAKAENMTKHDTTTRLQQGFIGICIGSDFKSVPLNNSGCTVLFMCTLKSHLYICLTGIDFQSI